MKRLRIAAWNVRTLMDTSKSKRPIRRTALIDIELQKANIDIAALSETRIAEEGSLRESNYTFFWKGYNTKAPRIHGVGFAIKNSLLNQTQPMPVGLSARITTMKLALQESRAINIISAYAPTLKAADETKEKFYDELRNLISSIPAKEDIILLGDFNARVGKDTDAWKGVIGRHGMGKMNANGELLASFCAEQGLIITIFTKAHGSTHAQGIGTN